ncbi:MAG: ExbD/TolR family protein [Endomicrobiales bacterium]|nr:ExbD/TolR family protein [Endomicrobiales bacterium]
MKQPIKRSKIMAEINITPFTDVVLVLLIIFMITTPLLLTPGIKVNLPNVKAAESETDKNITVLITADGKIMLGNIELGLEELKGEMSLRLMSSPNSPVVIKADRDVRYELVVQVMDTAKQAGARKFALGVEINEKRK